MWGVNFMVRRRNPDADSLASDRDEGGRIPASPAVCHWSSSTRKIDPGDAKYKIIIHIKITS